jgi:mannose-6-phosphate isomerase-like protein (cupin superfamily)
VAVFVPPGLPHQIRADGQETLRVVTVFSPPVIPGAYDPDSDQA